ncbi:MAG: hypothetical protein Q9180_002755 [Flavoplaca navasiana]
MTQHSYHKLIYQQQDDVEDLEVYQPGGYHPVNVGDVFSNGRYCVVHKLGWGSYSTVWLVRDAKLSRYVALKVIVASESKDSAESRILRHLSQNHNQEDGTMDFVTSLLDEFHVQGPNGYHLCLITNLTRCSIGASKKAHPWLFSLTVARAIVAQVIIAVRAIHRKGVVHGDLHLRNILLALPQIDSMSVAEIYQNFNPPRQNKVYRMDGGSPGLEAPSHTVKPAWVVTPCHQVHDPRICIADFGGAWLNADLLPKHGIQAPLVYLPPEDTFARNSLGFPVDIWTLACSIYEIMGDGPLLEGFLSDKDDMIAEMISCVGPLPQDWWNVWEARGDFFEEDGSWRTEMARCRDSKSRPLSQRIQDMGRETDPEFSTDEAKTLERMLGSMLKFKPEERASAEEIAGSEWMTRYGIPALRAHNILVSC